MSSSGDVQRLILVVEDDAGVATLQRRRLERADFRVLVANDVDGAMTALEEHAIDLVLLDYRLGATTGLDLHRKMKATGFHVPVILVSAAMEDAMVIEAIRAGVRDVLVKSPDYLEHLSDAVRAVLDQSAALPANRKDERLGARVLVVDDEEGVATLQRRRLQRSGYDVEVANTASDAAALIRSGTINLMVLDLRLGERSGLDLYEQLQAEGWHIPAILVTGFADQAVAIRALRAGVRDFVPKTADYLDYLPTAVDRVVAQVRLERKLVESELQLASIIGTTLDAIVMCDAEGAIVLFNRAAEEMFGTTAARALEARLDTFIPDVDLQAHNITPARRSRFRQRREVEGVRTDGTIIPIEISVSEVLVHQSKLFTVIARDVSERKRIEGELREADRRKDEFLGMLAHELRNPLAAVMTAGEVLHRQASDAGAQRLTAVIRRQTRALARMVDDLLDVSRVTLGKIELTREPLLVGELVGRTVEAVRETVMTAGISLDVDLDVEVTPLWVDGDMTRLEQVLSNLISNAVKFTQPGGSITLSARREGERAVIRVRDTGAGIDPALLPRVFDLFVQGDTSLARAKSGLGIGLALVRKLVRLHGGEVTAASEGVGKGAEFAVMLPLARVDGAASGDEASEDRRPATKLRVLVVDDQRDVADSIALLIDHVGHDSAAVYDGLAALEAARRMRPDVMIVDVGMPGMTGYELAGRVREDKALAEVRLVALTGYGRAEDRARALAAGFNVHLTKPLTESRLRDVLAQVVPYA